MHFCVVILFFSSPVLAPHDASYIFSSMETSLAQCTMQFAKDSLFNIFHRYFMLLVGMRCQMERCSSIDRFIDSSFFSKEKKMFFFSKIFFCKTKTEFDLFSWFFYSIAWRKFFVFFSIFTASLCHPSHAFVRRASNTLFSFLYIVLFNSTFFQMSFISLPGEDFCSVLLFYLLPDQ